MPFYDSAVGVSQYVLSKFWDSKNCLRASFNNIVERLTNITALSSERQWYYQSCNEFGWFPVSLYNSEPFGIKHPFGLFVTLCKDAFGMKFTDSYISRQINKTNKFFTKHRDLNNVYLTVGEYDPWRPLVMEVSNYTVNILAGKKLNNTFKI